VGCYSLASAPQRPGIELVGERLDEGEVSPYLTDVLRVGDLLELRGPVGGYFVWPTGTDGPVQLLAGGSSRRRRHRSCWCAARLALSRPSSVR
jgi:ferredoxin-NADP reductase